MKIQKDLVKLYMKDVEIKPLQDSRLIRLYDEYRVFPLSYYLSNGDIQLLYKWAKSPMNIKEKYRCVGELLGRRGFIVIGGGTNRRTYECIYDTRIVLKVSMDNGGFSSNKKEWFNQNVLKPFCCKVFEVDPTGTVALVEKVVPLKDKDEVKKYKQCIFDILFFKIRLNALGLDDIGLHAFKNWGIRAGFGPVLLDYPTMYVMDNLKSHCTNIQGNCLCGGSIDYDDGFDVIKCTECGTTYLTYSLAKKDGAELNSLLSAVGYNIAKSKPKEVVRMKFTITDSHGNEEIREVVGNRTKSVRYNRFGNVFKDKPYISANEMQTQQKSIRKPKFIVETYNSDGEVSNTDYINYNTTNDNGVNTPRKKKFNIIIEPMKKAEAEEPVVVPVKEEPVNPVVESESSESEEVKIEEPVVPIQEEEIVIPEEAINPVDEKVEVEEQKEIPLSATYNVIADSISDAKNSDITLDDMIAVFDTISTDARFNSSDTSSSVTENHILIDEYTARKLYREVVLASLEVFCINSVLPSQDVTSDNIMLADSYINDIMLHGVDEDKRFKTFYKMICTVKNTVTFLESILSFYNFMINKFSYEVDETSDGILYKLNKKLYEFMMSKIQFAIRDYGVSVVLGESSYKASNAFLILRKGLGGLVGINCDMDDTENVHIFRGTDYWYVHYVLNDEEENNEDISVTDSVVEEISLDVSKDDDEEVKAHQKNNNQSYSKGMSRKQQARFDKNNSHYRDDDKYDKKDNWK